MVNEEVIAEDVPKFQELLQNITQISNDVIPIISKLSEQVEKGDITVGNGVSLLDVKNNSLLLYLLDIITIILSKVNGVSLSDNEAVNRTVEFRTVLEKLRPLELKLKYQIDKTIQQAVTKPESTSESNPLQFKPNLDNFEESEDDVDETMEEENKKYIPPHIAATQHEEEDKRLAKLEKAKRDALTKSSLIAELIEETSDMPTEQSHRTVFKNKASRMQEERQKYEERNFTRLTLSKKQRSLEKKMLEKSELDTITSFRNFDMFTGTSGGSKDTGAKRKKSSKNSKSKRRKK